jgi:hypothetical protein
MIQYAREIQAPIEWSIILTTDHHRQLFVELLGEERVNVLDYSASEKTSDTDDSIYPGHLYRDIEAEKRTYKYADSSTQRIRAICLYRQAKRFMKRFRPSHALISQVEGFDGKVFMTSAREYGAEVVVPTSCRNIGGIFFSSDDLETIPSYASPTNPKHRFAAEEFVSNFRKSPTSARWMPDLLGDEQLDPFGKAFGIRTYNALVRWTSTPGSFQLDHLRSSILNNLPFVRDLWWNMRRWKNERYCDIKSLDALPKKFIFYPLQYSPESSINTPAPYFLDQFRAIDAIRFAMPSDCLLVVKEHPSCILLRDGAFVRRLQHTSGVIVAHYSLPSLELVRRAGLTISVTGTATLESMLLGKRAITLGNSLASCFLGGVCHIEDLDHRINSEFGVDIPYDNVVNSVATLFSARYDAFFASPGMVGEPILRRKNIERITDAFIDHCQRNVVSCNLREGS